MKAIVSSKPTVFIGSSTEELRYARAVHKHLHSVAQVDVWKDGCFQQNEGNLEALLRMLDVYDFAVFVLTPDDRVRYRDEEWSCPRDNVLFELGLFLGCLGRKRCFAIASDDRSLRLPTDLQVMIGRYESQRKDENYEAATGVACQAIIDEIGKQDKRPRHSSSHQEEPALTFQSKTQDEESDELLVRSGLSTDADASVTEFNHDPAAWFHSDRFTKAFPGVRGVDWITDPRDAVQRLKILLSHHLTWVWKNEDSGVFSVQPIWWWRGGRCNSI